MASLPVSPSLAHWLAQHSGVLALLPVSQQFALFEHHVDLLLEDDQGLRITLFFSRVHLRIMCTGLAAIMSEEPSGDATIR